MKIMRRVVKSPIGDIVITADNEAVLELGFADVATPNYFDSSPVISATQLWVDDYFSSKIPSFTPSVKFNSTDFRQKVWNYLLQIPYGELVTYSQIAKALNTSARAVGGAVRHNPIALIVPCHRVIGSDGSLTGFAWGLDRKEFLLKLERQYR